MDRQPVEALLVDPNPEDVELFLKALEDDRIANNIHTVSSGVEALDYLHQRGEYTDAPRPNLILLEIDLPQIDGGEMLERLNESPELAGIPVIVLTESDVPEDQVKSYELHTNAYVQKPVDPDDFLDVVRTLENFWLEVVWLPPSDDEDEVE